MEIKRCENGHFYDAEAYSSCPECAADAAGGHNAQGQFEDYGPTEPAGGFGQSSQGQFEDYGPTEPAGGFGQNSRGQFEDYGPTEPAGGFNYAPPASGFDAPIGVTMPASSNNGFIPVQTYDAVTEAASVISGVPNPYGANSGKKFSPAAGWLACIDGPMRGTDYRIRCGYNYIGRSDHMDICIKGDNQISREKHALIAYDDREKVFFFGPADGRSIVRLNDKMIMAPTQIEPYDILTIGQSRLLFVPLCGERFNWNDKV